MRYQLNFHDVDRLNTDDPDRVYHGQNQPFIPRVGELVSLGSGLRQVKEVRYVYEGDTSIRVTIITGREE